MNSKGLLINRFNYILLKKNRLYFEMRSSFRPAFLTCPKRENSKMFVKGIGMNWTRVTCLDTYGWGLMVTHTRSTSTLWQKMSSSSLKNAIDLSPVQTSCFCRAKLNSGIKFDKSTAEARHLNQTFELSSASN